MCADSPADRVPRVDPLPEEEWDDVLKAVVATTGPLNLFTTLARHPGLFHSWIGFGSMLLMRGRCPAGTASWPSCGRRTTGPAATSGSTTAGSGSPRG